jgi:hypothetical protein
MIHARPEGAAPLGERDGFCSDWLQRRPSTLSLGTMNHPMSAQALAIRATSLIQEDEEGAFTWSLWDEVSVDALIDARTSGAGPLFRYAEKDWWTLLTILSKTEWMKERHKSGHLEDMEWMDYAATEVDLFHVRIRSLLDHLAALLSRCSNHPRGMRLKFFDLKTHLQVPRKRKLFGHLGEDIHLVLQRTAWAEDLRQVRDDIVHRGADTLVFPDHNDILFQVHQREKRLVLLHDVMHNEHIVDFRKYAALTLGTLLNLREELAPILIEGLQMPRDERNQGWNRHGGLALLREWLQPLT